MKVKMRLLSCVRLFGTPWTVAYQASQSVGFSRQKYWSGLPLPSQGIFPTQGSNPGLQPCPTQWNNEPCHVGPPKMDGSWWKFLTNHGPLGKGMANHFSILAWNPMKSMKRQKNMTLKDELPRLLGAQYATGEEWRNNSIKNKETEPKQKKTPSWGHAWWWK